MFADLASGKIDAGVLWGPMAGYYARHAAEKVTVVPLVSEPANSMMDFRISMGVRHSDQAWKRTLNKLIAEDQGDINQHSCRLRRAADQRAGQAHHAMSGVRLAAVVLLLASAAAARRAA